MRPLPTAPLTLEDTAIWCVVYLRRGRRPEYGIGPASRADSSDAELMFQAQRVPCVLSVRRWDEGPEEPKIYLRGGKRVGTLEGSGIEIHEIEQATWHREQT
jgi:hypothetical protein